MTARKTDWLFMEQRIRAVLRTAATYPDNSAVTQYDLAVLLHEISEIVGTYTGRGYELNERLLERFPDVR